MSYYFVNPYNFISLQKECRKFAKIDKDKEAKLTGYMDCELETLTPLIMIDSIFKEEDKIGHVTFNKTFMLNGVPAIPASELRGCIRSKFETLTNSCLSNYEEKDVFYGRFKAGTIKKAGLLDFTDSNNVRLYSAEKYVVDEQMQQYDLINLKTGDEVFFYLEGDSNKPIIISKYEACENLKKGIYKKGEEFGKKKNDKGKISKHIFVQGKDITDDLKNKNKLKSLYEKCCELSYSNLKKSHNSQTDKKLRPVWYTTLDDFVYIALGQNGQIQYNNTMRDVISESYLPCNSKEKICEACYVFGTVQSDICISSKVRISDARLKNPECKDYYWESFPITLPELATPKFTNAYFYLQAKNQSGNELDPLKQWNVDKSFEFKKTKEQKYGKKSKEPTFSDIQISIRGRKEYWHHKPIFIAQQNNNMNVTVRPIKEGIKYQFKVYFDGITQEQLEHLHMAISLGKNEDFAHKLGMGKPLGFGSAKIRVDKIVIRTVSINKDTKEIVRELNEYIPEYEDVRSAFDKECLNDDQYSEVKCMYSMTYLPELFNEFGKYNDSYPRVDYPRNAPVPTNGADQVTVEESKIFNWFASNPKKKLPKADSRELVMQGKVKNQEVNRNGNRNGYQNRNRNGYRNGNKNGNQYRKY